MNVDYWLERADRALASAVMVAADGDPNGACSNAYYAMFYASRAALIEVGQPERAMGKTHSGMVSAFNQYLVHPGLLDRSFAHAFGFELNRRIIADYEEGGVDAQGAREAIASADALVSAVKEVVSQLRQPIRKQDGDEPA